MVESPAKRQLDQPVGSQQGYGTGGLGLQFGAVHLDYAVHAFEDGRAPGQVGTYVQTVRLMLRIQ